METTIRLAVSADIPILRDLIESSVRGLQTADYTPEQIERGLAEMYGIDTQLIADGTYFVAQRIEAGTIVGCGGWSKRAKLHGSDVWSDRDDTLLDPRTDAAKIRAFFVHPDWARRGIGSRILAHSETAARAAGFKRFEMGATRTGVALYAARGYHVIAQIDIVLGDGERLPVVRMEKDAR